MTPREFLESQSTLADAKAVLQKLIRHTARKRIYAFASANAIYDFDSVASEQWHRDYRDNVLAVATTHFNNAGAATNQAELIAVFDEIEQYL